MTRLAKTFGFTALLLPLAIGVLGCANQKAGERCDIRNGVTGGDCDPDLECRAIEGRGSPAPQVCCPPASQSSADIPECLRGTVVPEAGTTDDASTSDVNVSDVNVSDGAASDGTVSDASPAIDAEAGAPDAAGD